MNSKSIFGLSVALATAFDPQGNADIQKTLAQAQYCLANGCNGITLLGTTGEATSVTAAERTQLLKACSQAGITGDQLTVGIFATDYDLAVSQIREAVAHGAGSILFAPPFYFNPVSDDGVISWYGVVFDRLGADLPACLLYNLPSQTDVVISPGIVSRLREKYGDKIAGVKDSSGSADSTAAYLKQHSDIAILVGDERQLAVAVANGGQGAICGVANLYPEKMKNLIDTATEDLFINALVDELSRYPIIPALKFYMELQRGDKNWGRMRAPLTRLSADQQLSLRAWFEKNG